MKTYFLRDQTKNISTIIPQSGAAAVLLMLLMIGCSRTSQDAAVTPAPSEKICTPAEDQDDLFVEVEPETGEDVSDGDASRRVRRRRGVNVNFDVFKSTIRSKSRMRLPLFEDRSVDIEIANVQNLSTDNAVVTGQVVGEQLSDVTLVMRNGVLVGNVHRHSTGEHFEIRSDGNGVHSIRDVEETNTDDCLAIPDGSSTPQGTANDVAATAVANPVIDVLVAYTPAARAQQGGTDGMLALIQMGIADTNTAFTASGVGLSVRLVGTMEVAQNESSFSSDLTALRSKTDGKWDEVHAERARLGADQVSMVGYYTGSSTAGIGYISASATSAFTVTKTTAFGQYTFSHELGHNIGLQHSDGYENSTGKFRTIMAYGTYSRIRRYSNPSLTYNGYATSGGTQNSVSILNANASRMASLVATIVPVTPVATPTPVPTPVSTPTPTPIPAPTSTPGATPGATATPAPTATPSGSGGDGTTPVICP